ncbi:MAG: hypothetical protein AB8B80_11670 [Marinicellaceae bacterium]
MSVDIKRAKLKYDIPESRYLFLIENADPPKAGDIVELDQGYTGKDGLPMGSVYRVNQNGIDVYQAEVYDTELEIIYEK